MSVYDIEDLEIKSTNSDEPMTLDEFVDKHMITDAMIDDYRLIDVLDMLYLHFTAEQVKNIVSDYYKHADEIQNDIKATIENYIGKCRE